LLHQSSKSPHEKEKRTKKLLLRFLIKSLGKCEFKTIEFDLRVKLHVANLAEKALINEQITANLLLEMDPKRDPNKSKIKSLQKGQNK